jgi:hypothetical protein
LTHHLCMHGGIKTGVSIISKHKGHSSLSSPSSP